MARPTKYTPDTVKRVVEAIRMGSTYRLACMYAGISEDTFSLWQKKHTDFTDAIKEAEGKAVVGWLAKIEQAANEGAWQAAAWKTERRYPKEYGKQAIDLNHSGAIGRYEVEIGSKGDSTDPDIPTEDPTL